MSFQKNCVASSGRPSLAFIDILALHPTGRPRSWRGPFATATAVAAVMALPGYALAGPNGGTVAAGSATISQAGATTTINQSSNNAVINWQGFSIGKSETVNFNQPGVTSATLNRVTGNETSVINGALNANGQVFIVNQNGVLFGKNAQVNVGSLTASTLDISNTDFMAGNRTFSGASSASVVNQGHINAGSGGYVALLGKTVSNDGVIVARMGTVAMASGEKITLNFDGNSLVDVTIDQGALNALVENKKAIKADGGRVILTAKAADDILSAQVNNSGIIQARTMSQLMGGGAGGKTRVTHKGSIKLVAQGGTTNVSGKLDASAPKRGDGGFIETSGDTVRIADSAVITTKAANGVSGSWLVDPTNFTIAAIGGDITGAALGNLLNSNGTVTFSSTDGKSGTEGNVNVNDTVTWTSGATLVLNAANAINVNAVITGRNGGLTLNAGTDININAPSSLQVATVNATAATGGVAGDINFNAVQTFPAIDGTWTFNGRNINVNDAVNWSAGALTLNAGSDHGVAGAVGGFINLNAVMTASGTASLVMVYNTGYDTSTFPQDDGFGDIFDNPTVNYGTPFGGIVPLLDTDSTHTATFGTYIGRIDFASTNTAATPLKINGDAYTLITSFGQPTLADGVTPNPHDLSIINTNGGSGFYALATDLTAPGTALTTSPITQLAAGSALEGLGHNIAGYTFRNTTDFSGTFSLIGSNAGTIRDISMTGVDIFTGRDVGGALHGGALVDTNNGLIFNAAASGSIVVQNNPTASGGSANDPYVGGLVGNNEAGFVSDQPAIIYGGWTDVHVQALNVQAVGGLVGVNQGAYVPAIVANSTSIGTVESHLNTSSIQQTFLDGQAGTGGLVGANVGGTVSHSSSSSVVRIGTNGGDIEQVGGLVGNNSFGFWGFGGAIFSSVANGSIVFDGGSVGTIGGLAGGNSGFIDNSFSSTAIDPALGTAAAGFVGNNFGSITNSTWDPAAAGTDQALQTGSLPGDLTTGPGPVPGQGPSSSNAQQAANARSQAQSQTQQATALQADVVRAVAGASAANVVSTAALTRPSNPPSGADAAAGTRAASGSPASAAVSASLGAIQDSVQADDQRRVQRPRVASTRPAHQRRRPALGGSIREIEINGRRIQVPANQ